MQANEHALVTQRLAIGTAAGESVDVLDMLCRSVTHTKRVTATAGALYKEGKLKAAQWRKVDKEGAKARAERKQEQKRENAKREREKKVQQERVKAAKEAAKVQQKQGGVIAPRDPCYEQDVLGVSEPKT